MGRVFAPPDAAAVVNGTLYPGTTFIKALVDQLQIDIAADADLREEWSRDARSILADRGVCKALQNEIMRDAGLPLPQGIDMLMVENDCVSTSSCCCASATN